MGPDDGRGGGHARVRARFAHLVSKALGAPLPRRETIKRVQKNLSLIESDGRRLQGLARRDGLSQARLLGRALDAYEAHHGKLVE
ncbi:MAG: hypothetical protein J0I57_07495 [Hyphomicrobium sp.]|nr:hypothetical protein [Hyphomicrobium sp.]MBN9277464.1 hypothetical protein [Hyphomicrobium sp.]